jgi:hypothetical protein
MSQNQPDLPAQNSPYWHGLPAEIRLVFNHSSAQRYLLLLPETVRVVHGHAGAAILLTFFLFRMRYSADTEGWFQATREGIEAWTGMARDGQESARGRLRKLGLVAEAVRGLPGKLCFRVNVEVLYTRMLELENGHTQAGGTKPPNQEDGLNPTNKKGAKTHKQGGGLILTTKEAVNPHIPAGGAEPPKLAGVEDALEANTTGTTKTAASHDASIKELNTKELNANTISLDTSYQDLLSGESNKVVVSPDTPEKTANTTGTLPSLIAQSSSPAGKPTVSSEHPKSSRRAADAVRAMCEELNLVGWRLNFARVAVKDAASRAAWWQLARHHPELLRASYRLVDKTGERVPVTWMAWLPELVQEVQGHGEGAVLAAINRAITEGTSRGCWNFFRTLLRPRNGQSTPARPPQTSGPEQTRTDLNHLRQDWEERAKQFAAQWGVQ